jgi:hypothetical protein
MRRESISTARSSGAEARRARWDKSIVLLRVRLHYHTILASEGVAGFGGIEVKMQCPPADSSALVASTERTMRKGVVVPVFRGVGKGMKVIARWRQHVVFSNGEWKTGCISGWIVRAWKTVCASATQESSTSWDCFRESGWRCLSAGPSSSPWCASGPIRSGGNGTQAIAGTSFAR